MIPTRPKLGMKKPLPRKLALAILNDTLYGALRNASRAFGLFLDKLLGRMAFSFLPKPISPEPPDPKPMDLDVAR